MKGGGQNRNNDAIALDAVIQATNKKIATSLNNDAIVPVKACSAADGGEEDGQAATKMDRRH